MSTATRKAAAPGTFRVIVLDNIAEEGVAALEAAQNIEYEIQTGLKGDSLRDALNQFEGAVCRSGVKITADVLEGNTSLKAIVRAGVGTDNIDKAAATRRGIVVMNTPTGNTISTAEHAFALMIGLSRNLAPAHASLGAGKWDRKRFQGSQLCGKTLGVVGLGRIGLEVVKRGRAFGMEIIGYDPFMTAEKAGELGIRKVNTVAEMLPDIDYLTVHTPLTPDTKGMISDQEIATMRPGARLINCARGGIYDESALVRGLESGHLGGVALDVFENEPCTDSPLFQMDNVLCTPHLGASTEEAQINVAVEAVELLINFLSTGEIKQAVNTVAMDPATLDALRSYLDVAYRLGILHSQWFDGTIDRCELTFKGDICSKDTSLLTSAFCAGLLRDAFDNVSIVNAEVLCRDHGIEMTQSTTKRHGTFSSVISAVVAGGGESRRADGTVFGLNMPRLVRLNHYPTDSFLDGNLLVFTHTDVPGIIGYVGKILADDEVNIAQMAVGRRGQEAGGPAIGILNVDSEIPDNAIKDVVQHKGIDSARQIKLPPVGELPDWLK